jgi:hypothetical protein
MLEIHDPLTVIIEVLIILLSMLFAYMGLSESVEGGKISFSSIKKELNFKKGVVDK